MRRLTLLVYITAISSTDYLLAGPLDRTTEQKVGAEESLKGAVSVARGVILARFEERFGFKGADIIENDMAVIAGSEEVMREIASEKGWSKAESHLAMAAAWDYFRGGDKASKRPLEGKAFESLFKSLEYVKVTSKPDGATIHIQEYGDWGSTDDDGFLPAGKHNVTLNKSGYKQTKAEETVVAGKANHFSYELMLKEG
jgi:hypothetical protein